jgi:hypothetical protein
LPPSTRPTTHQQAPRRRQRHPHRRISPSPGFSLTRWQIVITLMNRPKYFLFFDSKSPNSNSSKSVHAFSVIFSKKCAWPTLNMKAP